MVELGIKNSLYIARLRHSIKSQLVAICSNISSLKSDFVTVIHKYCSSLPSSCVKTKKIE